MKSAALHFAFLPVLSLVIVLSPIPTAAQTPAATSPIAAAALPSAPLPATTTSSAEPMGIVLAPQPRPERPRLRFFDWSLLGAAATLRVLDYTSTESGLDHPQHLHEAVLPAALVADKPAFAAFEAGTVVVNYGAYRLLVRHHLRSLARVAQYMYIGIMSGQVAHNYQLISQVPAS